MSICPTCGRSARTFDPFGGVVTGTVSEYDAPLLTEAWRAMLGLLQLVDEPVRRDRLIMAARDGWTLANPKTCEQLVSAAIKAGLVTRTYRTDGTPRRRRAYVQLVRQDGRR